MAAVAVGRRGYRRAVVVACAGLAAAAGVWTGGSAPGDGLLLDLLIVARAAVAPARDTPEASPVAVVAIDQASLDSDDLRDTPRVLMGPAWAVVLDALFEAGARAVGFDVVFAYSGNQLVPDFDAPLLEALARHRDRVTLARSEATHPYIAFLGALGALDHPDRLGLATVDADADGVHRRVRAVASTGAPGLASALLRRAGIVTMPETVLLAPRRHLETIPTYAMADVLRCARAEPTLLARAFRGKLVLVGGTLTEEDRKVAAGRWLAPPVASSPPLGACGLKRLAASAPRSGTVPGVSLHAGAVEAVATGRLTSTTPPAATAALAALTAVAGAVLAFALTPWSAAAGVGGAGAILFAAGTAALVADVWVPVALPLASLVASPVVAYVARYLVEERTRRWIADAFTRFAPRDLVERLAEDPSALRRAGDRRAVTIMFADLSGFTDLSTRLPPEDLVSLTNRYLALIADTVEATGGYVDKFIGDAVMAIWGAPLPDERHAVHSVRAAMAAAARILEERAATPPGAPAYSIKIGLNSGEAIVGLVGTERRYNYTAVGETVNIASRLEGIPPLYGCHVVIAETTADLVHDEILLRELDRVQVKGRETPIAIHEPIAELASATPEQQACVKRYADALALYRARRFEEAASTWDALAQEEPPAPAHDAMDRRPPNPPAAMAAQARAHLARPPEPGWSGVNVLTSK